ncbi:MAG: alpha/beta hydrolase [Deltaproteobacteria bacterium]|nr:alpha/beta hydrolase [Deltaproteobacteria bacterium]
MPTIKANGIEIYYEITGSGPPLTLIMGLGCSARQWQWMVPVFAESFQVITFDNRGVGRTGKPDMDYTTDLFADDTHALLKALKIDKTHLLGASVGGMIAQKFALKYPEMVDRLGLGCTMPNFTHLPPTEEVLQRMQESQSQQLTIEEGVEMMIRLFLSEQFLADKPDQAAKLREVMITEKKEQGLDAFLLQLGAAMSHDTKDEVKNIKAPTLAIVGNLDPIAPVENSRFLVEQIPNSTLAEMTDVYHAFWVERFEEACEIIKKFLRKE